MPKPKRVCSKPGCPRLTRERYCDRHQDHPQQAQRAHDRRRGTATARGYNTRWRRFRAQVLAGEPLCRVCLAEGQYVQATDVDHIHPVSGPNDPTFYEPTAVQPLCHACHSRKTATHDGGLGNPNA